MDMELEEHRHPGGAPLSDQPWVENPVAIEQLADLLRPHLLQGFTVAVASMHRTGRADRKPAAYLDLTFSTGLQEICTVHGFKLMGKDGGDSLWLAVPQKKDERETGVKYIDTFEFSSNAVEKQARRAAVDEFRRLEAEP